MPASLADIGGNVGHASAREYGAKPKSANHSPLMAARAKTGGPGGEVPNFCPFGCPDENLDEHGYCVHLVGFTVGDTVVDGKHVAGKRFERVELCDDGHRRQKVVYELVKGKRRPVYEKIDPAKHAVPERSRITCNHRVYENVPLPARAEDVEDEPITDEFTDTADDSAE